MLFPWATAAKAAAASYTRHMLTLLSGMDTGRGYCISDDGAIIGGGCGHFAAPVVGGVPVWWDRATGIPHQMNWPAHSVSIDSGDPGWGVSNGSADGSRFIGYLDVDSVTKAIWWDRESGDATALNLLPSGTAAFGYALSGDGAYGVGGANDADGYEAVWWNIGTGTPTVLSVPDANAGDANALSADGATIAGDYADVDGNYHACWWDRGSGVATLLDGPFVGSSFTSAIWISGDGTIFAGQALDDTGDGLYHLVWWSRGSPTPTVIPTENADNNAIDQTGVLFGGNFGTHGQGTGLIVPRNSGPITTLPASIDLPWSEVTGLSNGGTFVSGAALDEIRRLPCWWGR